jgi:DNA-binding protein HU-beta
MSKPLTKTELVRAMAEKIGTSQKTAASFLDELTETALKETKKHGVFVIPGLGKLVKVHRKARMGRNPHSGEPIKIPSKDAIKFRVSKTAVNDVLGTPLKAKGKKKGSGGGYGGPLVRGN